MKRVDEGSDIMVAVISRDITERKALETRLRASERLEALGRLAGGVAHDFNNLLTVIGAAADLTRTVLPNEHPAVADVEAILDATRTAADLSRQLLTFSRKEVLLQDNINVAAVLGAQRNVLARLVGQSIVLEYDFEAHLPEVLTQASRVEQLAMNLAANARDAMSEGGRLNFSLRQREILRHEVEDLPAGLYLELKVRDQGAGIPNDILPHLFEPFFSTKGPRGTGLGLATCFGIVQQAGGSITVQSQLGIGTTFTVLLPAAHAEHNAIPLSNEATLVRTVLLVDDDPNVLQTTARMLRSEQFEVFTASTLAEARCILEDKDIVLGAMLTDVVLGEELGTDLLEPCRRLRPLTRIIVTSGYAPDGNPSEQVSAYRTVFVPKPFSREQLINAFG
jgi:nitrogen-specific signal transduction histidine kinase